MLVKNCFVSDGAGRSVRILDSKGCSMFTPIIQGNLQYSTNTNLASVQVWAYKFPDRSDLFFQCQIQLCHKEKKECSGITPPKCPTELMEPEDQIPMTTLATDSVTYVIGTFENFGNGISEAERSTATVARYQQKLKRSVLLNNRSINNNNNNNSQVWINDSDQMTIATYVKFHVQNGSHILNVTTGRVHVSDIGDDISLKANKAKRQREDCFICLNRIGYSFLIQAVVALLLLNLLQLFGVCHLWAKRRQQTQSNLSRTDVSFKRN
ncbi:hypothetical protein M514_00469 [Trichuris suis]|uniref:ZP domain-containing protein n=1 Tax=Trichuris suis TaxID=68888 RepID=A0A085NRG3_9BILA|nr:hypothetical protein M514_00469 [Trichuris suis]